MTRWIATLSTAGLLLAGPALAQNVTATPSTAELLQHNQAVQQNSTNSLTTQMGQTQNNLAASQAQRQQNFGPAPYGTLNTGAGFTPQHPVPPAAARHH